MGGAWGKGRWAMDESKELLVTLVWLVCDTATGNESRGRRHRQPLFARGQTSRSLVVTGSEKHSTPHGVMSGGQSKPPNVLDLVSAWDPNCSLSLFVREGF